MPLTPAHVAAVLPLRGRCNLPFAALAAGSMSPDLTYFLPFAAMPRNATHSVVGIFTWDLLFGVTMWLVWRQAAPTLHELAPAAVRSRWRRSPSRSPAWWAVVVAVIIGATTHVLWDSFTHAGVFASTTGVLAATYPSPVGLIPGYVHLQYITGVLGLAALLWVGVRQPGRSPIPRRQPRLAAITPALLVAGGGLAAVLRMLTIYLPTDLYALAHWMVTTFTRGALLTLALVCVLHVLVDRYRARKTSQKQTA